GHGILGLASACPASKTADPSLGCTADLDCKGERICEAGACVNPPKKDGRDPKGASSPQAKRDSNEDPENGPRAWTRVGPGLPWPSAYEGPPATPSVIWEFDLGIVVFGTPSIVKRAD